MAVDSFSVAFVLAILVVSGGIAYAADRLGKKLGKKRLSVWGLRPKHVATLGTVVMGVVLSFLTIAALAIPNRQTREWLQKGRGLVEENNQLEQKGVDLQRDIEERQRQAETLKAQNRRIQAENAGYLVANRRLKADLDQQKGELASVHAQLNQLTVQRDRLARDTSRLGGEVARLGEGLRSTRVALQTARTTLQANRMALSKAQASLLAYQGRIRKSQADLKNSNISFVVANDKANEALREQLKLWKQTTDLELKVTEGENQVADLERQQKDAEDKVATAQAQLATTETQVAELSRQANDLSARASDQARFLNAGFKTARTQPLTFQRGQELARVFVPAGSDAETARNALAVLIRAARVEATAHGARGNRSRGQTFEVADVYDREDPKSGVVIDADTLKRALVAGVTGQPEARALVATSSLNAFAGEAVSLDVAVVANPLIYRRNATVAEARIDGSQGEDEILARLSEFVAKDVPEQAAQDRMIPRAFAASPFGPISTKEVLGLVQDVKKTGRSVRVQAVAEGDIRAADPLRLGFRIR